MQELSAENQLHPAVGSNHLEKIPDTVSRFFEGSKYEMEQAHKTSPFNLILMYDSLTIAAGNRTVPATVNPLS